MKSPLVPLALLWLVSVQPCGALEVRWSSGARDIRLVSTERCTLIVSCTDPDESLPSEARLLYTGVSATGDRIRVLIESSVSAEAVVCARPSTSAEEDSSRIEAALFCRTLPGDAATRSERFVLEVPAGFAGKLKYVPLVCSGRACPDPPISPLEVTVNGGSQGSYPPLVLGALGRPVGLKLSVTIHGRELIDIDTVTLSNREVRTALSLLTASTELLVAEGPLPRSASWLITVTKNDGSLATVPLELPDAAAAPPDVASDYILLRLHPGLTTNVPDGNGGPVTAFTFADSVLATELVAARVNALTPVFPWFRPEDVHGRNLIGEPVKLENLSDIYFAQLAEDADPRVAVTALRDAPGVLWTGLDYGGDAGHVTIPNDPLFVNQWGLRDSIQLLCQQMTTGGKDIGAPTAWDRTTGAPSVRIAVLDTGIDTTHSELLGHVRAGPAFVNPAVGTSFDDDSNVHHGTAMAGIIAATGNNASAIAGVTWQTIPWGIKVLRGADHFARASWVGQGVSWATVNGMPIICMALGFPEVACANAVPIPQDSANILNAACLNALYNGSLPIASMGNCDGQVRHWPAAFDKRVYGVGAHYLTGLRWQDCLISQALCGSCDFTTCQGSSYGPWIDAVAPGGHLIITLAGGPSGLNSISPTCNPNNGFVGMAFGGTSAAAGFAAGIAGLLKAQEPSLMGEDMAAIMNQTASHPPQPTLRDDFTGYGRLRAGSATLRLAPPYRLFHHVIGPENTVGTLTDIDSVQVTQRFSNIPGLWGNVSYTAWRHRLRGTAQFNDGFAQTPSMWVRASGTWGWRDTTVAAATDTVIDYNDDVYWGRIVGPIVPPGWTGGLQTTTFETFVYRVINPSNANQGRWFPCAPDSARVAFTTNGWFSAVGVEDRYLEAERIDVRTWPNPGQRLVHIGFRLPERGVMSLSVLDVAGRRVKTLIDGIVPAGRQEVRWDVKADNGNACSPGVYFLQASLNGYTTTKRFLVLGSP